MQKYELSRIYGELRQAVADGRHGDANALLAAVTGLDLDPAQGFADADLLDASMASDLSFRGFKAAELAMLAANLKPVVKFEDIPIEQAMRFTRRYGGHYNLVVGPQYQKDYLALRSQPLERGASDRMAKALVCIYASRDDSARRLLEIEERDPANIHDTGALLGFPQCCIDAFAADFERCRDDQDDINDEACRRLAATASVDNPGHPALNPLSNHELLGFYPCDMHCEAAIAYATRTATALARVRPQHLGEVRRQLERPCLFWRLPFFVHFEGRFDGDRLRYQRATVNVFPDAEVADIQRLFASHLLPWLDRGDALEVVDGALVVASGDTVLRSWRLSGGVPPVLTALQPWGNDWADLLSQSSEQPVADPG